MCGFELILESEPYKTVAEPTLTCNLKPSKIYGQDMLDAVGEVRTNS